MPFLDNIVSQLNDKIITSSLNFIPSGKIKSYGISEPMILVQEDKVIQYPAIINSDGEATMIEVDDTYNVIMYHKLESITNGIVPKTNYGGISDLLETANMALVIVAFRDKVRRTSYWLENVIKDQFPDIMKVAGLQRSGIKIGNSNFDKLALLNREYIGVELNFSHIIIFELKYRIESAYKKGCFDNCGVGCETAVAQ